VVIDPDGFVLLARVVDPSSPVPVVWITPGGGIDGDESPAETAARELAEETGCDVGPAGLVGPVAVTSGEWTFRDRRLFSEDWFFWLERDRFSPQPRLLTEIEAEVHAGWRWWSLADLEVPDEPVLPGGLATLVRRLRDGGWAPGTPAIELPWVSVEPATD
jgi:8-oxo-dGTP pyrophosphatase MutT (NUDIX family)